MAINKPIMLIGREASGKTTAISLVPGSRYQVAGSTRYYMSVDGEPVLPVGTKIYRRGGDLLIELDGQAPIELTGWQAAQNAQLVDVPGALLFRDADATYTSGYGVTAIESGSFRMLDEAGGSIGTLGDPLQATGPAAPIDAGLITSWNPIAIGAGLALGVAALAGGGGASGSTGTGQSITPGGAAAAPPALVPNAGSNDLSAPTAITLTDASDSGIKGDLITNQARPVFQGRGTAGDTVVLLSAQGAVLGSAPVDAAGNWTLAPVAALGEATYAGADALHLRAISGGDTAKPARTSADVLVAITVDHTAPIITNKAFTLLEGFAPQTLIAGAAASTNTLALNADDRAGASSLRISDVAYIGGSPGFRPDVVLSLGTSGGAGSLALNTAVDPTVIDSNGSFTLALSVSDPAGNSSTQNVVFTVAAVNDAPLGADRTIGGLIASAKHVLTASDFGLTDPFDPVPNRLAAVIVNAPSVGTLSDNGVPIIARTVVPVADIAAGKLVYTPAAGGGNAALSFQVQDDGGTANGGVDTDPSANTLRFTSAAVNNPPVIISNPSAQVSVPENHAAVTTVQAKDSDSPAQTLTYSISGGADKASFTIDKASGALSFITPANFEAPASAAKSNVYSVQVKVDDSGSPSASTIQTLTVTVTPVDEAPVGESRQIDGLVAQTPHRLSVADFPFTDPNNSPANPLLSVTITDLPAGRLFIDNGNGRFDSDDRTVRAGNTIGVSDIAAGKLIYLPPRDAGTSDLPSTSLLFQVRDKGDATDSLDASANRLTLNFLRNSRGADANLAIKSVVDDSDAVGLRLSDLLDSGGQAALGGQSAMSANGVDAIGPTAATFAAGSVVIPVGVAPVVVPGLTELI